MTSAAVVLTATDNYSGAASSAYTVSGGHGDAATVHFPVTLVNDAPVVVDDAGFATDEDTQIVFGLPEVSSLVVSTRSTPATCSILRWT